MIIGNVRLSESGSSRRLLRKLGACLGLPVLSLSISCGLAPRAREAASVGYASRGYLAAGAALPEHGSGYVRGRPGDDTRWAAPLAKDALERAAAAVARALPGGAPLVVGDLSARTGGQHARHGSHRSGRDADLMFYVVDAAGRSVRGSGYYAFDQLGATSAHVPGGRLAALALFDDARNWALVRALIMDDEAPVTWIFCADGIKARLLSYAALTERDPRALVRAAYVLHQPTSGNPHRDHFHVRFACTARERALGCLDAGPIWPWQRLDHEKPERGGTDDDRTLVEALLSDRTDDPDGRR